MMNEQLSAWVDGEAGQDEAALVLGSVAQHAAQRETCELYWLIGDALRGQASGCGRLSVKVMASLASEPTVLAPRPVKATRVSGPARWMPIAAAVAGLAVAGWMGLSLSTPLATQSMARLETPAAAPAQQAAALNEDQAYFMAHQASAMGSPMVGVAQYIRTVSDERAGLR